MSEPAASPVVEKTTKSSLRRSVVAVAWSFAGLRKQSEYHEDIAKISPLHVLGVGFVGALLFVIFLIGLVHWVVH
jgi:Protein of unknown function (DUF2970)